MKLIKGDILSDIDPKKMTVILHGCNCFHTMGAGIAKYLKDKFPPVYQVDCKTSYGLNEKLGCISVAKVGNNLFVVNCYTQFNHIGKRDVNYEAIYKSLDEVVRRLYASSRKIKIEVRSPQIGCGLAGGEWSIVEKMYDHLLPQAKIYYI